MLSILFLLVNPYPFASMFFRLRTGLLSPGQWAQNHGEPPTIVRRLRSTHFGILVSIHLSVPLRLSAVRFLWLCLVATGAAFAKCCQSIDSPTDRAACRPSSAWRFERSRVESGPGLLWSSGRGIGAYKLSLLACDECCPAGYALDKSG